MRLFILIFVIFSFASPLISQSNKPCNSEGFRQFDFWVGEWDVFSPKGQYQGSNTIAIDLNDCLIKEHYTTEGPYKGYSYNTYDPRTETWNQVWVDNGGSTIHFSGKLEDGAMKLKGYRLNAQGKWVHDRLEFHPYPEKGEVHQIWTFSEDSINWQTAFYGIYVPKGQKPDDTYMTPMISSNFAAEVHRQFDFWIGEWKGKIKSRNTDGSWEESGSLNTSVYRILDGKAILEWSQGKNNGNIMQGYSIRYYDTKKKEWVSWLLWPGKQTLFYPLRGNFNHGRGEFFVSWTPPGGKYTTMRYTFSDIGPQSFRWDAARSLDSQKTWSSNQIFENTKTKSLPSWKQGKDPWFENWSVFPDTLKEVYQKLDFLIGDWSGTISYPGERNGKELPAKYAVYRIMNGRALAEVFEVGESYEEFAVSAYEDNGVWRKLSLSNEVDDGAHYYSLQEESGKFIFSEKTASGALIVIELDHKSDNLYIKKTRSVSGLSEDATLIFTSRLQRKK